MDFTYKIESPAAVTIGLSQLLHTGKFSDVVFVIQEDSVRIPAHRQILAAASLVFESMLYGPFVQGTKQQIILSGVSASTFRALLQFLYSGVLVIDIINLVPLIEAADRFCVNSAKNQLNKAADTLIDINRVDQELIYQVAVIINVSFNSGINQILEMCLEYVDINIHQFVMSEVFLKVPIEIIQLIFKRGTLNDGFMEVRLYLSALRWARGFGTIDESTSSNFQIESIKQEKLPELHRLLNYIRFPLIHAQYIIQHIEPSKLLSKDMLYLALAYQAAPQCYLHDPNPMFQQRIGSRRPWIWDQEKIGSHILLSADKKTAMAHNYDWEKVLGKIVWYAGIHYFSVTVEMNIAANSNSWQIIVGLTYPECQLNGHLGADSHQWGLACYSGHKISDRDKREPYATPSKRGDIITAKVDLKARTLEFFRNDTSLGVAYTDIRPPVIPAVSLLKGQKVTLQFDDVIN